MTTILYMFFDGFGVSGAGSTLVGSWSNPINIISSNARIEISSSNQRIDVTCQQ